MTLASEQELRRAAEAAPLVERVVALLAHVGPQGRAVTQTGALRVLDAKALAEACGDSERLHRPEHWQREVRRMADLPGVHEAYELAVRAGPAARDRDPGAARPGLPGAADPTAMAAALATAAVEVGVFVGDVPDHIADVVEAVDEQLPGLLSALYAAGEPVGTEELAGHLADEIGMPADSSWRGAVRSYLERAFARFERLGMLTRLGLHVPPGLAEIGLTDEQSTSVSLTPLGVWWWRQLLIENGVRAPLLGELAVASAGGLADGLQGYSQEDGQAELAAWTAVRGGEEAARQIAALLADPGCRPAAVLAGRPDGPAGRRERRPTAARRPGRAALRPDVARDERPRGRRQLPARRGRRAAVRRDRRPDPRPRRPRRAGRAAAGRGPGPAGRPGAAAVAGRLALHRTGAAGAGHDGSAGAEQGSAQGAVLVPLGGQGLRRTGPIRPRAARGWHAAGGRHDRVQG